MDLVASAANWLFGYATRSTSPEPIANTTSGSAKAEDADWWMCGRDGHVSKKGHGICMVCKLRGRGDVWI